MSSLFDSIIVKIGDKSRRLGTMLGAGTFGRVYLLQDVYLPDHEKHKLCAAKIVDISPDEVGENTFAYNCMRILGEVNSQKLFGMIGLAPHLYGVKLYETHATIIMDVVPSDYVSCRDIFNSGDDSLILKSFNRIVSTVEYLHFIGLQHGDLNPSNIFYNKTTNKVMFIDISMQVKDRPYIYDWGTLYYYLESPMINCSGNIRESMLDKLRTLGVDNIDADILKDALMFPHLTTYRFDVGLHQSIEKSLTGQSSVFLRSSVDHAIILHNRKICLDLFTKTGVTYYPGKLPFDVSLYFMALHICERLPTKIASNKDVFVLLMTTLLLYTGSDNFFDIKYKFIARTSKILLNHNKVDWDRLQFELLSSIDFQIMNMWEVHVFSEYLAKISDDDNREAAIRALLAISRLPEYLTNTPEMTANIVAYYLHDKHNYPRKYTAVHEASIDVIKHKYNSIESELLEKINEFNKTVDKVSWRDIFNSP